MPRNQGKRVFPFNDKVINALLFPTRRAGYRLCIPLEAGKTLETLQTFIDTKGGLVKVNGSKLS
jgi:hypothetical protein